MDQPVAQIAALICHSNALLCGMAIPPFFPANTTCTQVESIRFVQPRKTLLGRANQITLAATPNEWFTALRTRGAITLL